MTAAINLRRACSVPKFRIMSCESARVAARWLVEDDRAAFVNDDLPLDVAPDGPREDHLLEVPPRADQVLHRVAVSHMQDVLFDDGPGIQRLGHVVAPGSDHFYSPLPGCGVWASAGEGGKEGVVDVDHPAQIRLHEPARQYLHVSGEDDDVDPMALKEGHLLVFDLALVLLRDGAVSVDVLLVVEDAPSVGVDELGQTGGQAETEGAMQQQGDRPGLLWFVLGNVHSPSVPCAGLPELTHLE